MLISGAKSTMEIGLKFCVCGADIVNSPNTLPVGIAVGEQGQRRTRLLEQGPEEDVEDDEDHRRRHHLRFLPRALGKGPGEDPRNAIDEGAEQQLAHQRERGEVADEARSGFGFGARSSGW